MTVQKLEKSEWFPFFEYVSAALLTGKRAEIEVLSDRLGAQVEADWTPVFGIVYDYKDDIIDISLENTNHVIQGAREIYIDIAAVDDLAQIAVADGNGAWHHVKIRDPLMLPPSVSVRQGD